MTTATTPTAPALDEFAGTIDTLIQADGGETVLGNLRITVKRISRREGIINLVTIYHATIRVPSRCKPGRQVPWCVDYFLGYTPSDRDNVAEWHADILDELAHGPR